MTTDSFTCPIGYNIMIDPVICLDGHTYDRSNIQRWFLENRTSPLTGLQLLSTQLIPNIVLRNIIHETYPDLPSPEQVNENHNNENHNNQNLNNENHGSPILQHNSIDNHDYNDIILNSLNNLIISTNTIIEQINNTNSPTNIMGSQLTTPQIIHGFSNILTFSSNLMTDRNDLINNNYFNNRDNYIEDSSES